MDDRLGDHPLRGFLKKIYIEKLEDNKYGTTWYDVFIL